MQTTTTVEVKCDCTIPFRSELESHLEQVLGNPDQAKKKLKDLPNLRSMDVLIHSKIIFVKITNPIRKSRSLMLDTLKKLFHKEFVGIIKGAKNEITLILV